MAGTVSYTPGPVGEIMISQPDRRNAISAAMWRDLGAAQRSSRAWSISTLAWPPSISICVPFTKCASGEHR